MFISPAYAQEAAQQQDLFMSLMPLVLIGLVFYFLLIRPQQKRMKDHKAMVSAVRRGDKVVTAGGIFGTVTKVVSDTEVQIEIADDVRIRVVKGTISEVLSKPEPANANDAGDKKGGSKAAGGKS